MKPFNLWFILGLITIFGMTCASQWKPTTSYTATSDSIYKQLKDRKLPTDSIKLEDILLHTDSDGTMYFDTEKTKDLHGFTGDSIMHYYGYLFDLGEHNELKFNMKYGTNKGNGKEIKYLYDLYHKGYLLAPRIASSYILDNKVYSSGNGIDRYSAVNVDTAIKISPKEAFNVALEESRKVLEELGQEKFIWEYDDFKRYTPSNDEKSIKDKMKLVKIDNLQYQLVYQFEILISLAPLTSFEFLIDAKKGELIKKQSTVN